LALYPRRWHKKEGALAAWEAAAGRGPAPLMSGLTEREWCVGYRTEDGDLIELIYNPALECAVQYDRLTGYFSADSLALAARGIASLIANDGRTRLIVGLTLGPAEQRRGIWM